MSMDFNLSLQQDRGLQDFDLCVIQKALDTFGLMFRVTVLTWSVSGTRFLSVAPQNNNWTLFFMIPGGSLRSKEQNKNHGAAPPTAAGAVIPSNKANGHVPEHLEFGSSDQRTDFQSSSPGFRCSEPYSSESGEPLYDQWSSSLMMTTVMKNPHKSPWIIKSRRSQFGRNRLRRHPDILVDLHQYFAPQSFGNVAVLTTSRFIFEHY